MPSNYEGKRFGFVRGTNVMSQKIRDAKKPLTAEEIEEMARNSLPAAPPRPAPATN